MESSFPKLCKLRATFLKLHWAHTVGVLPDSFFSFCWKKHNTVNVHCAGEILNFWVVQLLCSRWCKHRAVIQWTENSLKSDCWLFINTQREETLGCARMASVSHSPLTPFSRGGGFLSSRLLSFQMVHFVGMPLMCSDTEFYAWSLLKHQKHSWFPFLTLFNLRACCFFGTTRHLHSANWSDC